MAIGKCVNISKPCSKALGREKIEADRANFVCPECGKPLVEIQDKKHKKKGADTDPRLNKKLLGIIAAAAVLLCGAGFGIWKLVDRGPEISGVKLDKKDITLVIGENQRDVLAATVVDKDGNEITDVKVTYKWTSSDDEVATVTQGGEVTALKEGEASITVKIEGNEKNLCDTCKVEVKEAPRPETPQPEEVLVTSLSVANAKISIRKGGTADIGLNIEPENVTEDITAESSNPEVATVEDSVIKAVKKGSATITVKTEKSGKTATIEVSVTDSGNNGGNGSAGGNGISKKNLGWGMYEGPANGFGGTITVTSTHTIDLKKASGETVTVNRGDKIVSVKMENGRLRQGEIHFADGTRKYLSGL
ncbi:MAG: Ig-like domain-containing protein [Bacteroidaceae bacterium]|nr:Ig-like domain-containing protein [Bacteroidaceae bacterium]